MGYRSWSEKTKNKHSAIYACYCCSNCYNPIIARITCSATQDVSNISLPFWMLEATDSEMTDAANAKAESVRAYLAAPKAENFPGESEERRKTLSVHGLDTPCPICEHVEPWQTVARLPILPMAEPIQVFDYLDEGFAWIQSMLNGRKNELDAAAKQMSPETLRVKRGEAERRLEQIRRETEAEKGTQELLALQEKAAQLKDRFNKISSFGKEKKAAKEELDACLRAIEEKTRLAAETELFSELKAAKPKKELCCLVWMTQRYQRKAVLTEMGSSMAFELLQEGREVPEDRIYSLQPLPEVVSVSAAPAPDASN